MREARGNLWTFHDQGHWVCILTNGIVKADGTAVMGAGVAKQAADRFPDLPRLYGVALKEFGHHVDYWDCFKLFVFPTKHHWQDPADLKLIEQSARELMQQLNEDDFTGPIYLPRPGTGLGGLDWESQVKSVIAPILDDRVVVVTY